MGSVHQTVSAGRARSYHLHPNADTLPRIASLSGDLSSMTAPPVRICSTFVGLVLIIVACWLVYPLTGLVDGIRL